MLRSSARGGAFTRARSVSPAPGRDHRRGRRVAPQVERVVHVPCRPPPNPLGNLEPPGGKTGAQHPFHRDDGVPRAADEQLDGERWKPQTRSSSTAARAPISELAGVDYEIACYALHETMEYLARAVTPGQGEALACRRDGAPAAAGEGRGCPPWYRVPARSRIAPEERRVRHGIHQRDRADLDHRGHARRSCTRCCARSARSIPSVEDAAFAMAWL